MWRAEEPKRERNKLRIHFICIIISREYGFQYSYYGSPIVRVSSVSVYFRFYVPAPSSEKDKWTRDAAECILDSCSARIKPRNGSTEFKCVERASSMMAMTTDESKWKETTVNHKKNGVSELLFVKCIRLYLHEMSAILFKISLFFFLSRYRRWTVLEIILLNAQIVHRRFASLQVDSGFFFRVGFVVSYHSKSDVAKSFQWRQRPAVQVNGALTCVYLMAHWARREQTMKTNSYFGHSPRPLCRREMGKWV